MENKKVVEILFGSHLYGLNTPASDRDYKGVVLPTAGQILMQEAKFSLKSSTGDPNAKNTSEDEDVEFVSLQRFIDFACQGETFAIDMLHAPENKIIHSSNLWNIIVENRDKFYTKNMKAYIGYVRKQAAKYGVKGSSLAILEEAIALVKESSSLEFKFMLGFVPKIVEDIIEYLPIGEYSQIVTQTHPSVREQTFYEICGRKFQTTLKIPMFLDALQNIYNSYGERAQAAKDNLGIDWKAISHALRAGYQARAIYKEGGFEYPLKETDFLLKVKQGQLDYLTEVQPELESLVDEVMMLADQSHYPEKVNRKFWNDFIEEVHREIVAADLEQW